MTDPVSNHGRTLHDPATGRDVELVYAIPPQLLGESSPADSGTSPAELLGRLLAGWRIIAGLTVMGALIGLCIALTTPNRYTASATALPPAEKGGGSGSLAQYAGLAAVAGVQLPGASSSSVDMIMAILASRRLQEPLIERFQLRDYYKAGTRDGVLAAFAADFSARNDKKTNTITIAVTNRDAARAAEIANATADLLKTAYNELAQSSATRERAFLEARLKDTEAELQVAAKALSEFKTAKGAIELESQTKATVEAIAKLQGELIGQQIELKAMLASAASPDNPLVQLRQERVSAMTGEMQRLLGAGGDGPGVLLGLASLPELSIAYVERYRAVKKFEAVLGALTAQLESARINEVRTNEVVTIIDRAYPPERKSGPPRAQICIVATLLAGLAGCGVVLLLPSLRRRRQPAADRSAA
jgi:tyrosine-protein kinase Etk/Wzc